MDQHHNRLLRRLTAAAVSIGMLVSLAACAKAPAETAPPQSPVTAETAITELQSRQEALGYENALSELTEKSTASIGGDTYIRLQQHYKGIPVYGKTIVYAADDQGAPIAVSGNVQDVDPELDLIPTVSSGKVLAAVDQFFSELPDMAGADEAAEVELRPEHLCIIAEGPDQKSHLAYRLTANGYELVIDAHDGSLLLSNCLVRWAAARNLDGQRVSYENVPVLEAEDGFRLTDEERRITSFQAKHEEIKKLWGLLTFQVNMENASEEIVWSEGGTPPADAVDAYINTRIVYDYFDQVLDHPAPDGQGEGQILLLTGIEYVLDENGDISGRLRNNASSGTSPELKATLMSFGSGTFGQPSPSAHLDWVAHEYMHAVEAYHSGMIYAGESGAIMEALSDIFGELVESWYSKRDPNWNFTGTDRNMRNPESSGYPSYVYGFSDSSSDDVHANSTAISHCAYLMWNGIDGNADMKLTNQQLAELWYRAMLMMPSDCDFFLCRQLVEVAAQSMEDLTEDQRSCISEAFYMVGIGSARTAADQADNHLAEDCTLTVYDENLVPYGGYTLIIRGAVDMEEIASNTIPDIGWAVNRTVTVENAGAYPLDLPQGFYTLTVIDSRSTEMYTIRLVISDEYTETNLKLLTACKAPPVEVVPEIDYTNLVTEAFSDSFADQDGWNYCYHIPQFQLHGDLAQQINRKIADHCFVILNQQVYPSMQEYGYPDVSQMVYAWGHHGDLASVLIQTEVCMVEYTNYDAFTISLTTGREATMDQLLAEFGLDREEYYALVRQRLEEYWNARREYRTDSGAEFFDDRVARTLAQENISAAIPYINSSGGLSFAANIYSLAGGDSYWHLINAEGTLEAEHLQCRQTHPIKTPVSASDPLEYFIENCDRMYLTESSLQGFDKEMCLYARNAIYAKSGRIFTMEKLVNFFQKYSWYNPTIPGEEFREDLLNPYQVANRELVVAYENKMETGTSAGQQDALEFFIENCDSRYFTLSEISSLDAEELMYARNAIYAKSGRIFTMEKLADFFSKYSWYSPTIPGDDFSEDILNPYQIANRDLIVAFEAEKQQ